MCKKKKECCCCPIPNTPININLNESRWSPRNCCCENNNNLDKYAISALTQQNSFMNLLGVATLFNNNNNNNNNQRDRYDHHHHHHKHHKHYKHHNCGERYSSFIPGFSPWPYMIQGVPDYYNNRPYYSHNY